MGIAYKILLTRPYSWITILSVALLGSILARGTLKPDFYLFIDILFAMFIWMAGTFFTEYWHRKTDARINIPKYLLYVLLIAIFGICFLRNAITIFLVLFLVLCNILYSFKVKPWKLSHLGFIFRGFLEISILISILFFYGNYNIIPHLGLILAIFLFTDARNLIADIRDIDIDKFTFPKKYGEGMTYGVSAFLILLGIIIIGNFLLTFPMVVSLLILLLRHEKKYSYKLHKIFVLSTGFFILNYVVYLLGYNLLIVNLFFLVSILNFTYDFVPRKSNYYYISK